MEGKGKESRNTPSINSCVRPCLDRLWSGVRIVSPLGLGVQVSTSFQISALTALGNVLAVEGIFRGNVQGNGLHSLKMQAIK